MPAGSGLRPDPRAPDYDRRDPRAPGRLSGSTHALELSIAERYATVANGYVMSLWTIDGSVPGPVVRVGAGDTLRVHVVNHPPKSSYPEAHPAANDYPHSVVFEGSAGGWADQLMPIARGADRFVEFTMPDAGVWLYHGAQPAFQSIVYGMSGMMIVEPAGGLDRVAQELFFVQGEWYLDAWYPATPRPPSLAKAAAADPRPDFVVLNGAAGQYLDTPIPVTARERVRVFLLNAGPNLEMRFRIGGATFDRVIKGGVELDVRGGQGSGARAVHLAPGQGAMVELTLPAGGRYPILTDGLDAAGAAAGLLEAVDPGR